jgi:hypothetical protein
LKEIARGGLRIRQPGTGKKRIRRPTQRPAANGPKIRTDEPERRQITEAR